MLEWPKTQSMCFLTTFGCTFCEEEVSKLIVLVEDCTFWDDRPKEGNVGASADSHSVKEKKNMSQ